ncbi:hypothetical protein [Gilvimarinus agarilyticus]|uniref:hypothetical protein n=1 Tax=Gilvimarinus agarilyticus TaxID=679259 RepID=UPI0005A03DE1|nr:hypothetical protein [Gilvimarinus agarilyticus]
MLDWIAKNQGPLSVLINAGMLGIWVLYAQLLLRDYRRKLRPKILINQSLGTALQSHCLICNMSEQSFYVSLVLADLTIDDQAYRCSVTDLEIHEAEQTKNITIQGPIKGGDYRNIGAFNNIVQGALKANDLDEQMLQQAQKLTLYVIGIYGSENQAVGAKREFCFDTDHHGDICLNPTHIDTDNLTGRRHQKKIRRWLEDYL